MKEEKGNNAYAYISIVAIVAIVALFVMFAGSGNKETQTPQTIVLSGENVVGDAFFAHDTISDEPCQNSDCCLCDWGDGNSHCSCNILNCEYKQEGTWTNIACDPYSR